MLPSLDRDMENNPDLTAISNTGRTTYIVGASGTYFTNASLVFAVSFNAPSESLAFPYYHDTLRYITLYITI